MTLFALPWAPQRRTSSPVAELDEAFAKTARGRYDYGESAGEPALREEIIKLSHSVGVATRMTGLW
jgi:hypothetical protein